MGWRSRRRKRLLTVDPGEPYSGWLDQLHHGYVKDWETLEFDHATHHDEMPDPTRKKRGGVVWPSDDALAIAPEIGDQ